MTQQYILYFTFLSQIFLISYFIPRYVLGRMQYVLKNYPQSEYPKLYPLSKDAINTAISTYKGANYFALAVGVIIWLFSVSNQATELLNWKSQLVITSYFFLQVIPLFMLTAYSMKYLKLMRKADTSTRKTADLQPRKLTDFVPLGLLSASVLTYVAFIALVLWIQQDPFQGFQGHWNIVGITAANAWFFILILHMIYGKKADPHQTSEGRFKQTAVAIKQMVKASIAINVFLLLMLSLSWLELRSVTDIVLSIYFQFIMILAITSINFSEVDFSVYRKDPVIA